MSMRTTCHEALSARGPPAQASHVRLGRRFVDEDETAGGELTLLGPPLPSSFGDIGPALLGGMERLFLYVSPRATSAWCTAGTVQAIDSFSLIWAKVRSGWAATSANSPSRYSGRILAFLPE